MDGGNVNEILNRSIEELFPNRVGSELQESHFIQTVGDLVQKSEDELLRHGSSREMLYEMKETLSGVGLSLGMRFNADGTLIIRAAADSAKLDAPRSEVERNAHPRERAAVVPRTGEYLLYLFLPKDKRECIPGDLAEEFTTIIVPKFGFTYGRFWYCKQVAASICPIIWPQLKRLAGIPRILTAVKEFLRWRGY